MSMTIVTSSGTSYTLTTPVVILGASPPLSVSTCEFVGSLVARPAPFDTCMGTSQLDRKIIIPMV